MCVEVGLRVSETKKPTPAFECANVCVCRVCLRVHVCVCMCVCVFQCVDWESLQGNLGWFVAWLCVFELGLWFPDADVLV